MEEYEPYGEEWEKEMMRFTKKEIIKMYGNNVRYLQSKIDELCPPPTPEFQAALDSIPKGLL